MHKNLTPNNTHPSAATDVVKYTVQKKCSLLWHGDTRDNGDTVPSENSHFPQINETRNGETFTRPDLQSNAGVAMECEAL